MRDYYRNFATENSGNTQFTEPTNPTKAPSARFVGSLTNVFAEKTNYEYLAIVDELDDDQLIIFERADRDNEARRRAQ